MDVQLTGDKDIYIKIIQQVWTGLGLDSSFLDSFRDTALYVVLHSCSSLPFPWIFCPTRPGEIDVANSSQEILPTTKKS